MAAASRGPLDGAARGRLRWAVNSTNWCPAGEKSGAEFRYLLSLIREDADRLQVDKFLRFADAKRALLARLLVRRASAAVLGLDSFATLRIERTKGKKPFLASPRPPSPDLANFNFNVSHEGDWVVLASEPLCVCGVDVAAPEMARPGGARMDIFRDFQDQLTTEEWRVVRAEAATVVPLEGEQPGYQAFQRFWSCKEAFVKARGDGLGFELNRCSFAFRDLEPQDGAELAPSYLATVTVDQRPAPEWRFFQHRLENHWVTVARGPTTSVQDANGALKATLKRPTEEFSPEAWEAQLCESSPAFDVVSVGFLVPAADLAGFEQATGVQSA